MKKMAGHSGSLGASYEDGDLLHKALFDGKARRVRSADSDQTCSRS